jgi:hypothetical protein
MNIRVKDIFGEAIINVNEENFIRIINNLKRRGNVITIYRDILYIKGVDNMEYNVDDDIVSIVKQMGFLVVE